MSQSCSSTWKSFAPHWSDGPPISGKRGMCPQDLQVTPYQEEIWAGIDVAVHHIYVRLWRACSLTSLSPCLTSPVDYLFASCHKGHGFKSLGGYLCETGIPLLALTRYIGEPDMIDNFCGLVWGGLRP
jgi:hypothetical protein